MTEPEYNGKTPRELINEMAAQMGLEGELSQEMVDQVTTVLMERIGQRDMDAEFTQTRDAVCTYLTLIEKDDTIAAILSINQLDPAGVIAMLGSLVLYWADFLRSGYHEETRETLPAGEMARVTFESVERQQAAHAVPDEADA